MGRSTSVLWLATIAAGVALSGVAVAAQVTWTGAVNGTWDTSTANWTGAASTFTTGDDVTFNDSGATGGITVVAGGVSPASTTVDNGSLAFTINGTISGSGGLTKSGSGSLTMQGTSSFSGGTVVSGGTLILAGGGGASGNVRGSMTINAGATVQANSLASWGFGFGNGSQAVSSVAVNAGTIDFGGTIYDSGGWSVATATLTGGTISGTTFDWFNGQTNTPTLATLADATTSTVSSGFNLRLNSNNLTIDVADGAAADDLVISGDIKGGGIYSPNQANGITKTGAGRLVLSGGGNDFTGGTVVNAGTLALTAGGQNAGKIRGALTINAGATVQASTDWAMGWSLTNNGTTVSTIAVNGGTLEFTGGTNTGGMQASTMTLTGGTVSGSTFHWYNGITSNPSLVTQASTASSVVSSGFRLRLNGGSLTLDVADGAAADDLLISGVIWSSDVSGLVKTGAGLARLSQANTYQGDTTVSAGTLAVDGSLGSVGALTLNGGTLAGTGTIGQAATAAGGVIAPGNQAGTLTFTNGLTIASGSTAFSFDLDPTNQTVGGGVNDLVVAAGGLTLDGILNVTAIGGGDFTSVPDNTTWRLFNYTGNFTDLGLSLGALPAVGAGRSYQINTATAGQVSITVVPEPSALAAVGVAVVSAAAARRWRRRS